VANTKLQELDKQKTSFFQNVSHELRTPLTLIMNPLDSLFKKSPEDQDIRIAFQNSNRLFRLVNQLLDFQKLSSKSMNLKLFEINIRTFLKTCCQFFQSVCTSKNITILQEFCHDDEIYILGQVDALEKIVFNYLSNAFKYSPQNGIIKVMLEVKSDHVIISIKDNGPGISKENQSKLFKIFSQTDDSAIREYEGTGLGLALVKELTEAMNGEVFVESSIGYGSTFGLKFKRYIKKASQDLETENNISLDLTNYTPKKWHIGGLENKDNDDAEEEHTEGEGKLIIVIDDLKDMRDLIKRSLIKHSYKVITAKNGQEGLEKISEFKPDCAIIDWMMPKLSGPEVIEQMSQIDGIKSIPTILLTAKNDEASKAIGIKKGAHAYLGKPFDELELISTIENLIHLKEGDEKIRELNKNLVENVLTRFLPQRLVSDIILGHKVFDDRPKLAEITVLFADLVNFTAKSEDLGAHVISTLLNEYFEKMTGVAYSHNGTVDKFMGDGIMIIFGAPEAETSEVQVENALDCALSMQEQLKCLNESWRKNYKVEFSMRIGIHKGAGVVGSFGSAKRTEYTVIGPVVNMSSRIEKAASPGQIYFSSTVRDLISKRSCVKAGSFSLKGIGNVSLFTLGSEGANAA
ncbi:MAG: response regulator, partial [Oligoflexales bacterium]|nr:response regulator [Oligoflexales bacterium]